MSMEERNQAFRQQKENDDKFLDKLRRVHLQTQLSVAIIQTSTQTVSAGENRVSAFVSPVQTPPKEVWNLATKIGLRRVGVNA